MVNLLKNYEDGAPNEAEVRKKLEEEGLSTETKSEDPGTVHEPVPAESNRAICVIAGMVRFTLPDSPEEYADLMGGDRIDIPAGTVNGMLVGPAGVTFVEGK